MDGKAVSFSLLDFTPNGRKLYLACEPAESPLRSRDITLAAVNVASGKIGKHVKADRIHEAALSPDGRLLVYSPVKHEHRIVGKYARVYTTPSNQIVLWETASESVRTRFKKTNAWVNSVSCSPDSRYFATGLYDSTILIWDCRKLVDKR
jgi:WD40 repeat protein